MRRDLLGALARWLAEGSRQIGEVLVTPSDGVFELRHARDQGRADLGLHTTAGAARQLSLFAEDGSFRPLKTAPNLRRGWRLQLATLPEVRQALDAFYPAMLGLWLDHELGRLAPVDLRETLARQSGMYAITRKLTDAQAQELIGGFCASATGCLKTILWRIAEGVPVATLPPGKFEPAMPQASPTLAAPLPMLCHEACNLLVAKAREVVKK